MAVRKIRLLGDPALRETCKRVTDVASPEVQSTIRDLRDTLEHFRSTHRFGRGIAAPQIGIALRVIFLRAGNLGALVNPVIVRRSKRKFSLWDDCFSFPDLLVLLERHYAIEVVYQDAEGRSRRVKASGAFAELLQHEIDHIHGILAIDRAKDSRSIILRSERRKAGLIFNG